MKNSQISPDRFSELTAPRQALVRLCQDINYGQVLDLHVSDGEPVFTPLPKLLLDIKLEGDCPVRPEPGLSDFALCDGVRRLLDQIERMHAGRFQRIEVRAGIPRRALIETTLTDVVR